MKYKIIILFLWVLTLSSCSLFSPVNVNPPSSYVIDSIPQNIPKRKQTSHILLIMPPYSEPIYNTSQMAYKLKPYQINYFVNNQWGTTPSRMLLTLMESTLQKTGKFKVVVTPPYPGMYDYLMTSQIIAFEEDFTKRPVSFKISVKVNLINVQNSRVVKTKLFNVSVPVEHNDPYSVVIAANQASKLLMSQLAYFTIKQIER